MGRKPGPKRSSFTVSLPRSMQEALKERCGMGAQSSGIEAALIAFMARRRPLVFPCVDADDWSKNTFHVTPETKAAVLALKTRCGPMFTMQNVTYSALLRFLATGS